MNNQITSDKKIISKGFNLYFVNVGPALFKQIPTDTGTPTSFMERNSNNMAVLPVNTLRPSQDGRRFPDDIFKWLFFNEIIWISIKISKNFVLRCPVNNIPALVQIMAWRRPGDKPLSEPMIVRLPTHICVTRPQRVNATEVTSIITDIKHNSPVWDSISAAIIKAEYPNLIGVLTYILNMSITENSMLSIMMYRHPVKLSHVEYHKDPS